MDEGPDQRFDAEQHFDVVVVGAGLSGILVPAIICRRNVPAATSFWKDAAELAGRGIYSAIPAFAPIRTCSRWAFPSRAGRERGRSATVPRS